MSAPHGVRVRAPAKVNLALHVGPVRGDGYHDIATVYQAVDLHDELVAEPAPAGAVSVRTRDERGAGVDGVCDDHTNLAVRAAEALRTAAGVRLGVRLSVRKRIPVAGGMAGGSADAAAALVACDALWRLDVGRDTLLRVAATLGSDVPFAVLGGTALGTGRGERLRPLTGLPTRTWVLVGSRPGLSTPQVYAAVDRLRSGAEPPAPALASAVDPALVDALHRRDIGPLARALHNDLQDTALAKRPELAEVLDAAVAAGAAGAVVCGSGPTLAALVADDEAARGVATAVAPVAAGSLAGAWVRTVHGPVPGPLGAARSR